ncbi:hypothetical protein ANO11243_096430 [Dothideomycetidae sp. 11243]|nr:hypothetical protein ANO11243_096430 [fungal sp. No.11243]
MIRAGIVDVSTTADETGSTVRNGDLRPCVFVVPECSSSRGAGGYGGTLAAATAPNSICKRVLVDGSATDCILISARRLVAWTAVSTGESLFSARAPTHATTGDFLCSWRGPGILSHLTRSATGNQPDFHPVFQKIMVHRPPARAPARSQTACRFHRASWLLSGAVVHGQWARWKRYCGWVLSTCFSSSRGPPKPATTGSPMRRAVKQTHIQASS